MIHMQPTPAAPLPTPTLIAWLFSDDLGIVTWRRTGLAAWVTNELSHGGEFVVLICPSRSRRRSNRNPRRREHQQQGEQE